MAAITTARLSLAERVLYAIPVIGWMLKDVVHGERDNIYHFLFTMVCLWAISGLVFGLPGVVVPAVVFAPLILLVIVLITRG
jgi:uncharacterized membrane protein